MSAIAVKWAFRLQSESPIPPTSHHVLLCLADRYNPKHEAAWPSYPDIRRRTGLAERTIARAIDDLEQRGIVKRQPRLSPSGRKIGVVYRFPLLDHGWAEERQSYDFDEHGKYDEQAAAENLTDMPDMFDRMFPKG